MAARQSAATDRALRMIARGVKPTLAAARAGIAYSTLYRALKRQGEAEIVAMLRETARRAFEIDPPAAQIEPESTPPTAEQ